MKNYFSKIILLVIVVSIGLTGCQSLNGQSTSQLNASGTISVAQVNIAPQLGGMVISANASEGSQVKKGDELFRLDDSLLIAQRDQANAAIAMAEAALNSAQVQYEIVLNAAHLQDQQNRMTSWNITQPNQFELPTWYFDKDEKITAAKVEMDAASADLEVEKINLKKILTDDASHGFLNAEKRVANAQVAFLIADQVLTQANGAQDKVDLQNFAQDQYDAAETELNSAQTNYNRLVTTQAAKDVLEGRARVRVAQERFDRALDYYNSLMSGDQSLQVKAAESGVKQAKAALSQAQAALALLDVQLEKTVVNAPVDGTVLIRNLEVGEMLAPTGVVLIIGQLQEVNLTVYIPETEYGRVKLGDQVSITVDSFPGETFSGTVVYISDQAEFTPRNVQTVEGRKTTVYAVKLSVPNADLKLKPGMPADVTFGIK